MNYHHATKVCRAINNGSWRTLSFHAHEIVCVRGKARIHVVHRDTGYAFTLNKEPNARMKAALEHVLTLEKEAADVEQD